MAYVHHVSWITSNVVQSRTTGFGRTPVLRQIVNMPPELEVPWWLVENYVTTDDIFKHIY